MGEFDFGRFEALTFDCYGTLIDWERGIAPRSGPQGPARPEPGDEAVLERYAPIEARLEAGPVPPLTARSGHRDS